MLERNESENGTITYTYNSDHTLHTKGGLTYSYDNYKRLTQVMSGSTVLRTFMYDSNTLDGSYSGSYTAGRLVAVQHTVFVPPGYVAQGNNGPIPSLIQFTEMYGYKQSGLNQRETTAGE